MTVVKMKMMLVITVRRSRLRSTTSRARHGAAQLTTAEHVRQAAATAGVQEDQEDQAERREHVDDDQDRIDHLGDTPDFTEISRIPSRAAIPELEPRPRVLRPPPLDDAREVVGIE